MSSDELQRAFSTLRFHARIQNPIGGDLQRKDLCIIAVLVIPPKEFAAAQAIPLLGCMLQKYT